ncbi:hypothetical protein NQ318_011258 [Aromia moschata]|uniref:Uncharacterized protein n=1 Tax=Aromia moschata TaxID=1265417 RepID=A0AAV8YJS0_9CUCU|nr:hypothetical protein NQ318_011258 [Aromia moschata]
MILDIDLIEYPYIFFDAEFESNLNKVNTPSKFCDRENNTIIEDEFPTAVVADHSHSIKKREIVVDEEAKVAYVNICDTDTDKKGPAPPPMMDELSRTTRDIEWSSFAKTSKEFFIKVLVVADNSMVKYHVTEENLTHYILTLMSHVRTYRVPVVILADRKTVSKPIVMDRRSTKVLLDEKIYKCRLSEAGKTRLAN